MILHIIICNHTHDYRVQNPHKYWFYSTLLCVGETREDGVLYECWGVSMADSRDGGIIFNMSKTVCSLYSAKCQYWNCNQALFSKWIYCCYVNKSGQEILSILHK